MLNNTTRSQLRRTITFERGPPSKEDASKSIPIAPMRAPSSSAMKRTAIDIVMGHIPYQVYNIVFEQMARYSRVPAGASFSFQALKKPSPSHVHDSSPWRGVHSLHDKHIIHRDDIDVVHTFGFELLICLNIPRDLLRTRPREGARHSNLVDEPTFCVNTPAKGRAGI